MTTPFLDMPTRTKTHSGAHKARAIAAEKAGPATVLTAGESVVGYWSLNQKWKSDDAIRRIRAKARGLVCGIQASIREAGEQGPPGGYHSA